MPWVDFDHGCAAMAFWKTVLPKCHGWISHWNGSPDPKISPPIYLCEKFPTIRSLSSISVVTVAEKDGSIFRHKMQMVGRYIFSANQLCMRFPQPLLKSDRPTLSYQMRKFSPHTLNLIRVLRQPSQAGLLFAIPYTEGHILKLSLCQKIAEKSDHANINLTIEF